MTHVLSGYTTDPDGEVQVASFHAGYRRKDPFTFVFFVLLQFHLGVRMTPVPTENAAYLVRMGTERILANGDRARRLGRAHIPHQAPAGCSC